MLAKRSDLAGVLDIADWAEAGRPLIVRRFVAEEPRDCVPLGLPLPPTAGKRRILFAFSVDDLSPYRCPTLRDARPAAPATWLPTLDALIGLGAEYDVVPRPFGSLLWQALTGLPYLSSRSDLDVLWPLEAAARPTGLLAGLARIAGPAPMRLDGEILLPDGAGLHWRELLDAPENGEVLAKTLERLELRPVARLGQSLKP